MERVFLNGMHRFAANRAGFELNTSATASLRANIIRSAVIHPSISSSGGVPGRILPASISTLGPTIRTPGSMPPTNAGFTGNINDLYPKYPKRGLGYYVFPNLTRIALPSYALFRAATVLQVVMHAPESLPIALGLFGAELHSIYNGMGFQKDVLKEGKYEKQKIKLAPKPGQVSDLLGPRGPRTLMEISSAGEDPMTVRPTLEGALEIEGNRQVVWCSQANLGPKGEKAEDVYRMKAELVEKINEEYGAVWKFIDDKVSGGSAVAAAVDTRGWTVNKQEQDDRVKLEGKWNSLSDAQKREALRNIYSMLGRRYITIGGIYIWSGSPTPNMPNELVMTEMCRRLFTGELRNCGEIKEVGLAREVDISQYGYTDGSTNKKYIENLDALASRILQCVNDASGDRLIYGHEHLRELVNDDKISMMIEQATKDYAETPVYKKFSRLEQTEKMKEMSKQLRSFLEQEDYSGANNEFKKITGEKIELRNVPPYFAKNVRKGGEDIKIGLEYEARAAEAAGMDASKLNEEFTRLMNTYADHKVEWWDRDILADQDHGGRKSNSMNSLILHLGGRWEKWKKVGAACPARGNTGEIITNKDKRIDGQACIVAQDTYSALMRCFIETFVNGQELWRAIEPQMKQYLGIKMFLGQVEIDNLAHNLEMAFKDSKVKPQKFVVISEFLKKLNDLAGKGKITRSILEIALRKEGFIGKNEYTGMFSGWELRHYAARLRRSHDDDARIKHLRLFFDDKVKRLNFAPTAEQIKDLAKLAISDTQGPKGYELMETYDFSNIRYFTNIDAEVNPRPEFLETTLPYFENLQKKEKQGRSKFRPTILQTPQFYVIDPVREDKLRLVAMKDQRLFYQTIQPSKSMLRGSFSCGSNVTYDLEPMREISDLEFADPKAPPKKQEPGGWSHNFIGSEIFRTDANGNKRPVIMFIPPDTPVEDCEFSFKAVSRKKYYTAYHDKILGKGEAPKDLKNLLGFQHPKWASTVGMFFHRLMPTFLRWIPLATPAAKLIIKFENLPVIAQLIGLVGWVGNGIHNAVVKHGKTLEKQKKDIAAAEKKGQPVSKAKYYANKLLFHSVTATAGYGLFEGPYRAVRWADNMLMETSMQTRPKVNPLTVLGLNGIGYEFFRAGTWYLRGARDAILMATPSLYIFMYALTVLGGNTSEAVMNSFTPMIMNFGITLAFVMSSFATSMMAYLGKMSRLGQKKWDVMVHKEGTFLSQGWPGYLHASFWSLLGPSGRPGATTDKGALGHDPLPWKYRIPMISMFTFNLVTSITGLAFVGMGLSDFGPSLYYTLGGCGMMTVTFWSIWNTLLGAAGMHVGKGGPRTTREQVARVLKKRGDLNKLNKKFYPGEDLIELQKEGH